MNLQNWVQQARAHWKEHLPKLYHQLQASGTLEAALQDAAERTYQEVVALEEAGYDLQGAWEIVRESYLFPPEPNSLYAMTRQDSPMWKGSEPATATEMLHAAMKSGAREIAIPQPKESKAK